MALALQIRLRSPSSAHPEGSPHVLEAYPRHRCQKLIRQTVPKSSRVQRMAAKTLQGYPSPSVLVDCAAKLCLSLSRPDNSLRLSRIRQSA